mmetsp:Transcript_4628/g.12119  ORF Transcript_4628/g.12119 Transcript_4628/m.12119 type:complete len:214 (+) Transcript_4628:181-822(+)
MMCGFRASLSRKITRKPGHASDLVHRPRRICVMKSRDVSLMNSPASSASFLRRTASVMRLSLSMSCSCFRRTLACSAATFLRSNICSSCTRCETSSCVSWTSQSHPHWLQYLPAGCLFQCRASSSSLASLSFSARSKSLWGAVRWDKGDACDGLNALHTLTPHFLQPALLTPNQSLPRTLWFKAFILSERFKMSSLEPSPVLLLGCRTGFAVW